MKLLGLNERKMFLAKFALDDEGRLLLCAEAPVKNLHSQLLKRSLESMTVYGSLYPEILPALEPQEAAPDKPAAPTAPKPPDAATGVLAETLTDFVRSVALENWWPLEAPSRDTWKLGYKGRLRLYDVYLSVSASWCIFQVPLLLEAKPSALRLGHDARALFLRYLLRLNDAFYMVKFGIDEGGRVLLLLELPLQNLTYELFLFAVRTISSYLENYTQELEIVASPERDKKIFELLSRADTPESPSQRSN
jgi:hypothetical protein